MSQQSTHEILSGLHVDIFGRKDHSGNVVAGGLVHATSALGWDRGDQPDDEDFAKLDPNDMGAKPIKFDDWLKAFLITSAIAKALPQLDRPTPGADANGFIWMTYRQLPDRIFALEIHKDGDSSEAKYIWTQRIGTNDPHKFSSDSIDDIVHAMQSVFRRIAI